MVRGGLFEVTVSSPGIGTLNEYPDPDEASERQTIDGPTEIRYLEAVAGANFVLHFKIHPGLVFNGSEIVSFRNLVDGARIQSPILQAKSYSGFGWTATWEGSKFLTSDGRWQLQKYQFNSLSVSEDELNTRNAKDVAAMSTLRIMVHKAKILNASVPTAAPSSASNLKVSEKSIKGRALDVGTRFAAPVASTGIQLFDTKVLDEAPLATMLFKYRTRTGLQREGIIERSPTPTPGGNDEYPNLSREELQDRLRRAKADADNSRKVKEEQLSQKALKRKRSYGEDRHVTKRGGVPVKDESDEEVLVVEGPQKGPLPGQEVLEISDDEE